MRWTVALLAAFALTACGDEPAEPEAASTEVPQELQEDAPAPVESSEQIEGATAMEERVATLGLLNKRNNISQDLEMKPGESRRIGDVIIRLSACERRPPWDMQPETAAFVQVLVEGKGDNAGEWSKIHSGWLFQRSPSVNVVEHPVYDVWVKDCAMTYPGESEPPAPLEGSGPEQPEPEEAEEAAEDTEA